jgi:hypothetical protein
MIDCLSAEAVDRAAVAERRARAELPVGAAPAVGRDVARGARTEERLAAGAAIARCVTAPPAGGTACAEGSTSAVVQGRAAARAIW